MDRFLFAGRLKRVDDLTDAKIIIALDFFDSVSRL